MRLFHQPCQIRGPTQLGVRERVGEGGGGGGGGGVERGRESGGRDRRKEGIEKDRETQPESLYHTHHDKHYGRIWEYSHEQ